MLFIKCFKVELSSDSRFLSGFDEKRPWRKLLALSIDLSLLLLFIFDISLKASSFLDINK